MYLNFYRFKHKPFQISTDPRFLWLGEKHKEALATLRYGVLDNKGFLLLTGDVGTGKTTLINALLQTLDNNTYVAFIRDPALDPLDFFQYTAHTFGMPIHSITSKAAFLIQFEQFLLDAYERKRKVVLIIDEAQRISQNLLEEIRLLSNIERAESKLLNIFFIGQIEFNDILHRPENRPIRQRITINYNISPLSEKETRRYIMHRLEVASLDNNISSFTPLQRQSDGQYIKQGYKLPLPETRRGFFSDQAIREVYAFSKGYPRLINIICDRAILTGALEEATFITLRHVQECVQELEIPRFKESEPSSTASPSPQQHANEGDVKPQIIDTPSSHIAEAKTPDNIQHSISEEMLPEAAARVPTTDEKAESLSFETAGMAQDTTHSAKKKGHAAHHPPYIHDNDQQNTQAILEELAQLAQQQNADSQGNINIPINALAAEKHDGETATPPAVASSRRRRLFFIMALLLVIASGLYYGTPYMKNASLLSPTITTRAQDLWQTTYGAFKAFFAKEKMFTGDTQPTDSTSKTTSSAAPVTTRQNNTLQASATLIIPFRIGSSIPSDSSLAELNTFADTLQKSPTTTLQITYFSSQDVHETMPAELIELHANAIKGYLMGKGINGSRIAMKNGSKSHSPPGTNTDGSTITHWAQLEISR
ncbi:MAG: ExeA family protein [Desulfopila sp.]